ncbi:MAG TPA: penicillin-binding transpeptidase domain-containing protein, partial [Caulobacteraceae bacterium]
DKTLNGTFPPGSTFKLTTALALLEAGVDPEQRVFCSGAWRTGNRTQRCWGTHGSQSMHDAIKNSCDVYFYAMCNRAGVDKIKEVAMGLGFMQTFDIGVGNQRKGLIPSTAWKRETYPNDPVWHPGETTSVAIGQGAVTVNALQLAVMASRVANGRKALNPRLIKSIGGVEQPSGAEAPDLPFKREHMEVLQGGMRAVANDTSGTAYRQSQLGLGDILMAGKTGTAQVRDYSRAASRKSSSVTWRLKDHNLFVAYAPVDAPRYAVAVIIEHGGLGGATAGAPRAREIMRTALLKDPEMRGRITRPPPPAPTGPEVANEGAAPVEGAAPPPPVATAPPTPAPAPAPAPTPAPAAPQ